MSSDNAQHALDERLAESTLWGWYKPTLALAWKHWQLCVAAGLVAFALDWLFGAMALRSIGRGWWVGMLATYAEMVAYGVAVAAGYRFLAEREKVGTINEWPAIIGRVVEIQTIWMVAGCVVAGVFVLLLLAAGFGVGVNGVFALIAWAWLRWLLGIVTFLLMPIWFSFGIATALAEVYAVRSSKSGWGAVKASLQLAFDQKWRVFWPSYVIVILGVVLYFVVSVIAIYMAFAAGVLLSLLVPVALLLKVVPYVFILPSMFVLERTYASHLTIGAAAAAELPSRPPPSTVPPRVRTPLGPPAPPAPLPTGPNEIADRLADDVRTNRMQQVVETVEHGLKADPRFFVAHPDETLALARRLANVKRADLALRVVQPYLKEQRAHRQHLTVALCAANLLLRDLGRKADAARFLAQVKTLYPNEPMVDQLIRSTDKAIAEGAGAA